MRKRPTQRHRAWIIGATGPNYHQQEVEGVFEPVDTKLFHAAMTYHYTAESFDQSVCSGDRNGVAIPATPREYSMVTIQARDLFRRLAGWLHEQGVCSAAGEAMDALRDEIMRTSRYFDQEWENGKRTYEESVL